MSKLEVYIVQIRSRLENEYEKYSSSLNLTEREVQRKKTLKSSGSG